MGIITSIFGSAEVNKESGLYLSNLTKSELIQYVELMKTHKIPVNDEFYQIINNIDLEATKIIPMSIELYNKLSNIQHIKNKEKKLAIDYFFNKRKIYINPEFTDADVIKSISPTKQVDIDFIELNISNSILVAMNYDIIDLEEFNQVFSENIINKKDAIGMSKLVLKNMSDYLKNRFINSYNDIIINPENHDYSHSIATCYYVYKDAKKGDKKDINSFRKIISLPNVVNHLHRILYMRLVNYMLSNNFIDLNIIKGSIPNNKFSILEQVFKIKNIIKDANKNQKTCTILFLDITNAFGSVNLNNLYKILDFYKVDPSFIQYLSLFYHNLQYYVKVNNNSIGPFDWSEGLVQGCSLSPFLFTVVMNYILSYLNNTHWFIHGYSINELINILFTAYVDDCTIICKNTESAQIIFDEFDRLCKMMGLVISMPKCAMIEINQDVNNYPINDLIKSVDKFKYLGEYIYKDGTYNQSFIELISNLIRRLRIIDVKVVGNIQKRAAFNKYVLSWVKRKTILMYEMTVKEKLKIISIIKKYMIKWENTDKIDLFVNISDIIRESQDTVIQKIAQNDDQIFTNTNNIKISEYIIDKININFNYNDIDNDIIIDEHLQAMFE